MLRCCWLDPEDIPCGDPAEPHRNLPLCPVHVETTQARARSGVQRLARAAMRYHGLFEYPGFCYFVLLPDGTVKIGFSHTEELLFARTKNLSRQYGAQVVPLRVIRGGFVAEALMHDRFDHLRLPGNGERFELRDELAEYLAADKAV